MDHQGVNFDANGDSITKNTEMKQEPAEHVQMSEAIGQNNVVHHFPTQVKQESNECASEDSERSSNQTRSSISNTSTTPMASPGEMIRSSQTVTGVSKGLKENLGIPERIAIIIVESPGETASLNEIWNGLCNDENNETIEAVLQILDSGGLFRKILKKGTENDHHKWGIAHGWEFSKEDHYFRRKLIIPHNPPNQRKRRVANSISAKPDSKKMQDSEEPVLDKNLCEPRPLNRSNNLQAPCETMMALKRNEDVSCAQNTRNCISPVVIATIIAESAGAVTTFEHICSGIARLDSFCEPPHLLTQITFASLSGGEHFDKLFFTDNHGNICCKWAISDNWMFFLQKAELCRIRNGRRTHPRPYIAEKYMLKPKTIQPDQQTLTMQKDLLKNPPHPWDILCGMAIHQGSAHALTLDDIYAYMRTNFSWLLHKHRWDWCDSIRLALIANDHHFQRFVLDPRLLNQCGPEPDRWAFRDNVSFDFERKIFVSLPADNVITGQFFNMGFIKSSMPSTSPFNISVYIAIAILKLPGSCATDIQIIRSLMHSHRDSCSSFAFWSAAVHHHLGNNVYFRIHPNKRERTWMIQPRWVFDASRSIFVQSRLFSVGGSACGTVISTSKPAMSAKQRPSYRVSDVTGKYSLIQPSKQIGNCGSPLEVDNITNIPMQLMDVGKSESGTHLQKQSLKRSSTPPRKATPMMAQSLPETSDICSLSNIAVCLPTEEVVEATLTPIENNESMPISQATSKKAGQHKKGRGRPKKLTLDSTSDKPSKVTRQLKRPTTTSTSTHTSPKRSNMTSDQLSDNTKQTESGSDSSKIEPKRSARVRERVNKAQQENMTAQENIQIQLVNEKGLMTVPIHPEQYDATGMEKTGAGTNLEEHQVVEDTSASNESSDISLTNNELNEAAIKMEHTSTDEFENQDVVQVSESTCRPIDIDALSQGAMVISNSTESTQTVQEPEQEIVPASKEAESPPNSSSPFIEHFKKEPVDEDIICLDDLPVEASKDGNADSAPPPSIDDSRANDQLNEEVQGDAVTLVSTISTQTDTVDGESGGQTRPSRPFESVSNGSHRWYSFPQTLTGNKNDDEISFTEAIERVEFMHKDRPLILVIEMMSDTSAEVPEKLKNLLCAASGVVAYEFNKPFERNMEEIVVGQFKNCTLKVPHTGGVITASIWQRDDGIKPFTDRVPEENLFTLIENKFTIPLKPNEKLHQVVDIVHLTFIDN